MHRVFVSPRQIEASRIIIDESSAVHHLRTVLRVAPGDRLTCVDGGGREYEGAITECDARRLIMRIEASRPSVEAGPALWLAQGIPKGSRFEWAIEKATELGASRIAPLLTRHTVVRIAERASSAKVARWRRVAAAAARQCRRAVVPVIDPPQSLEAFMDALPPDGLIVMPTLQVSAPPLSEMLASRAPGCVGPVIVLIGPEGDFSKEEVAMAQARGAQPVSLGMLTLRSETAAVAALAMVRYAFGCP